MQLEELLLLHILKGNAVDTLDTVCIAFCKAFGDLSIIRYEENIRRDKLSEIYKETFKDLSVIKNQLKDKLKNI